MVVKAVVAYKYCVLGGITAQIEVFSLKELTVCAYVFYSIRTTLYEYNDAFQVQIESSTLYFTQD